MLVAESVQLALRNGPYPKWCLAIIEYTYIHTYVSRHFAGNPLAMIGATAIHFTIFGIAGTKRSVLPVIAGELGTEYMVIRKRTAAARPCFDRVKCIYAKVRQTSTKC